MSYKFFKLLNINENSDLQIIKKAFFKKIKEYHPDKAKEEADNNIAKYLIQEYNKIIKNYDSFKNKYYKDDYISYRNEDIETLTISDYNNINFKCDQCETINKIELNDIKDSVNINENEIIIECDSCNYLINLLF